MKQNRTALYVLADAKKSKLLITYVPGERIEKKVAKILATPAKAKEKLSFLVPGKRPEN